MPYLFEVNIKNLGKLILTDYQLSSFRDITVCFLSNELWISPKWLWGVLFEIILGPTRKLMFGESYEF